MTKPQIRTHEERRRSFRALRDRAPRAAQAGQHSLGQGRAA